MYLWLYIYLYECKCTKAESAVNNKNNKSTLSVYRVSQKTWEFSDEFDIVFVMN